MKILSEDFNNLYLGTKLLDIYSFDNVLLNLVYLNIKNMRYENFYFHKNTIKKIIYY